MQTISISPFLNHYGRAGPWTRRYESDERKVPAGRPPSGFPTLPDADVALEGVVREYRLSPIGFTQADRVQRYRVVVRTRIRLHDKGRKKLLINQDLESYAEFAVSSSIAQSDMSRSNAHQQAADSLSKDVVSLVLEGF